MPSFKRGSSASASFMLFIAAILLILGIFLRSLDLYSFLLFRLVACWISAYCAYLLKSHNVRLFWLMILLTFVFNPIVLSILYPWIPALMYLDVVIALSFLWIAGKYRAVEPPHPKEKDYRLIRILIAGCVSLTIDFSMIHSFKIVKSEDDRTIHDRINEYLGTPAFILLDHMAPQNDIFLRWAGILIISALFYGVVTWLILTLWAQLQKRLMHR